MATLERIALEGAGMESSDGRITNPRVRGGRRAVTSFHANMF